MPCDSSGRGTGCRRTGIFYHPGFSRGSYLTQGARLRDFPAALKDLLASGRHVLYEPEPIGEEWVLKVHSRKLLEGVRLDPLCSTAFHSVGAVVMGAEKIASGEIRNAFSFIGAGGHHSGRDVFGGYCCFNDVVIAMRVLRERWGFARFAILDTDAHHGEGVRELVGDDPDILHVCVCDENFESPDGTKVDVLVPACPPAGDPDSHYSDTVIAGFSGRVRGFQPEFLFWYFGFDTHQGDYGDMGLTVNAYLPIAAAMRRLSEDLCEGRLHVVLGGGSRRDIATAVIPPLIAALAGEE